MSRWPEAGIAAVGETDSAAQTLHEAGSAAALAKLPGPSYLSAGTVMTVRGCLLGL